MGEKTRREVPGNGELAMPHQSHVTQQLQRGAKCLAPWRPPASHGTWMVWM